MEIFATFLLILLGLFVYGGLCVLAVAITRNRRDFTPLWEVILLCILLTPVLAIILEMLKPYKPIERK